MKKIFTIFFLLTSFQTYGQLNLEWERKTNAGAGWSSMAVDSNNNILVLVIDGNNMKTLKYSPGGDLLWSRIFVSQYGICVPKKIAVDPKGNVYISGSQFLFTTVKYDSNGNQLWARYFTESAESEVMDMAVDTSGNVYITGEGWYYGMKPLTMKYNTNGVLQWARFYHIPGYYGIGRAIALDQNNNVFITGSLNQGVPGITLKYDTEGNLLWNREKDAIFRSIGIDNQGNVISAGHTRSLQNYSEDMFICKYSNSGDSHWCRRYSIFGSDTNYSHFIFTLSLDNNNDIYVAGHGGGKYTNFRRSGIAAKINSSGQMIWSYVYLDTITVGNLSSNFEKSVLDNQGNYYVIGSKGVDNHPLYYTDLLCFKFSPTGKILWKIDRNLLINRTQFGKEVKVDKNSNVFTLEFDLLNDTMIITKYSQTVGIINEIEIIPEEFTLFQNYPNPFNPSTSIKFDIANSGNVKLIIFDLLGREVSTLVNENLNPGTYQVSFDGSSFSSGVYFYKLKVGDQIVDTKKMILLK